MWNIDNVVALEETTLTLVLVSTHLQDNLDLKDRVKGRVMPALNILETCKHE